MPAVAWHDGPNARDNPLVDDFLETLEPKQRDICQEVRARVKADPGVLEFIAWGVPCYWKHGPLCYTSPAKGHVTLGFFRGIEIGMGLVGTGKSPVAKHVCSLDGLPSGFDAWVRRALELDLEGA